MADVDIATKPVATPDSGDWVYGSDGGATRRFTIPSLRDPMGAASATVAITSATGAYTLVLADAGKAVEVTSASAVTVTVPPNSSVAFPVGTVIEVAQLGAGTVTIAAGTGVTIRSRGGLLALAGQYAVASLRKRATDEWLLAGDVA